MFDSKIFITLIVPIYLVLCFRYVWKAKHPELSIWKAYARVVLIVCSLPIIVFLTAYISSMLVYVLTGDAAILSSSSGAVISGVAMFPLLPAIYVARRIIKTPPRGFKGTLSDQALA